MIASLGLFLHELLRPGATGPHGGYWFWSGIGSDFGEVTLIGVILSVAAGFYRHHECHVDGCRLPGHLDPKVQAPACPKHHSLGHLRGKSHAVKRKTAAK